MDNYEKYYRRTYNAINRLMQVYSTGYNKESLLKHRNELINNAKGIENVRYMEHQTLNLTILIALLGLNKESMENTGKFSNYKQNFYKLNIESLNLCKATKDALKIFNNSKSVSTEFDEWLSIIKNPNTDNSNLSYIRRVRNGLLHSNFYVEDLSPTFLFTHIKIKSYYESLILNSEFVLFVQTYFSNLEGMGLSENLLLFDFVDKEVKNKEDLFKFIKAITIKKYNYKNSQYDGSISPETIVYDMQKDNDKINTDKYEKTIHKLKNLEDFSIDSFYLKDSFIMAVINYIENRHGDKFYTYTKDDQRTILTSYLNNQLNSKREISNWLLHFWMFTLSLESPELDTSFFDGDEFANEMCYPSLIILKAYLVMYRLQQENFDEINYGDIEFDLNTNDFYKFSYNMEKEDIQTNCFEQSFNKEKCKGNFENDEQIWNKIICEVIRNGMAHGNLRVSIENTKLQSIIEIKDINKKTNNVRVIQMTVNKFFKFLNSRAFEPKYCYKKAEKVK